MIQGNNEWLLEDLFFAVNGQSNLVIDGILWKLFKFDWSNRKGPKAYKSANWEMICLRGRFALPAGASEIIS